MRNHITQLVRHTIHYIETQRHCGNILFNDADTRYAVQNIIDSTPSFNIRDRERIKSSNRKPINHPYYTEYTPLQQLCMAILSQDTLSYGTEEDKIHGLLFDGAWLWEEYLATIFTDYIHPDNRIGKGNIKLFERGKYIYPDFYKVNQSKVTDIIDAKYKPMQNDNREDFYQLLSYMFRLNSKTGHLIYPFNSDTNRNFNKEKEELKLSANVVSPAIQDSAIIKRGIPIPTEVKTFDVFSQEMRMVEENLKIMMSEL